MRMSAGILFIVSAPSGAGKTSLVKALRSNDGDLGLAVSYTTRSPRPGEQNGVHYHFVDSATFEAMVVSGAFLEHAEVFGKRYGTAEETVRAELGQGRDLILEIDWQGARQVRTRFPEAVSIFVLPPSLAALEERLRGRGQDDAEVIAGRMARARAELSHYGEYDYLVVNDRFEEALAELGCVVRAERLRRERQVQSLSALLTDLGGAVRDP
jgi:guanylate kinase